MFIKLATLAERTFSTIAHGDGETEIAGAAGLDIAKAGEITFLANPKYTPQIKNTQASAIFLNEKETIERNDIAVLRAKDPYLAYTRALRLFNPAPFFAPFIHQLSSIDESATVAADVSVDAFVSI